MSSNHSSTLKSSISVHTIDRGLVNGDGEAQNTSPTNSKTDIPSGQAEYNKGSAQCSQSEGEKEASLRKSHSYKCIEEPPRNQDGKITCRYEKCTGFTFSRKSDWKKHMDKHDRPYKCAVNGCENLQGFTYSGGRIRHEHEVHKMHGGIKKSLFCPFADCKRSSGTSFTRNENLAEHVRRVHRRTRSSADLHGLVVRYRNMDCSIETGSQFVSLLSEIKRLQVESREQASRMLRLEQLVEELKNQT